MSDTIESMGVGVGVGVGGGKCIENLLRSCFTFSDRVSACVRMRMYITRCK